MLSDAIINQDIVDQPVQRAIIGRPLDNTTDYYQTTPVNVLWKISGDDRDVWRKVFRDHNLLGPSTEGRLHRARLYRVGAIIILSCAMIPADENFVKEQIYQLGLLITVLQDKKQEEPLTASEVQFDSDAMQPGGHANWLQQLKEAAVNLAQM